MKYAKYFAFIFDVIAVVYLVAVVTVFYQINISASLAIIAIFLIFPAFIFQSIGPRSFSLTPRNFSQLMCTCGYVTLVVFFKADSWLALEVASMFYAISILSSKFSVQYIILALIFISILQLSIYPILFIINILFFALVIGGKSLFRQIKGQLRHSLWYMNDGLAFISGRWNWSKLIALVIKGEFRSAWQIVMFHNPVTRGILLCLPVFVISIYCTLHYSTLDVMQKISLLLILSSIFLWILTQFSIFRAFGEPERYLEYSVPQFFFLLLTHSYLNLASWLLLAYAVIFILYMQRLNKNQSGERAGLLLDEVKQSLSKEKAKSILCTYNSESYYFVDVTDHVLVGFFSNNIKSEFYKFFYSVYPHVNPKHYHELCRRYKITHIVFNKQHSLALSHMHPEHQLIMENDNYQLLRVNISNG